MHIRRSVTVELLCRAILCGCILLALQSAMAQGAPDVVLNATVGGSQNRSYIELPFNVPGGTGRLTVSFKFTGKDERTTLDLGIEDPSGFRGWSGGNKDTFTIGQSDATPSYLPGVITAGVWKLLIGVPNIRPQNTSTLEAKIYFTPESQFSSHGFAAQPVESGARWYRGDLHLHTGHSDGRCTSQSGKDIPCPVFITLQAAARRGLDFVAITDHNTTSQFNSLRELQPYFDRLLLIPGREITTFQGHANVFGATDFLDFRVSSASVPQMNSMLEQARKMGALASINHPGLPSGETCMGCGWKPATAVNMRLVAAVEVVNGGIESGPFSGFGFWEQQLQDGHRLTGIGGSDNHRPEMPLDQAGSVGSPTTVVYAQELSAAAILGGIRAGHVFVDHTGSRDRLLEFSASTGQSSAHAGDNLETPAGTETKVTVHVTGCQGSVALFWLDGKQNQLLPDIPITSGDQTLQFNWKNDGGHHWMRTEVKTAEGRLQLLSNPIYFNYQPAPSETSSASSTLKQTNRSRTQRSNRSVSHKGAR